MSLDLRGKTALVTGATGELGWALARELGRRGARVAVVARHEEPLLQLELQIRADGGDAVHFCVDLSRRGAAVELADTARAVLGRVDIVVNAAATGKPSGANVGADTDEARAVFETSYWSAVALTCALLPDMRARGRGTIVNVAGGPLPGARAAIVMRTKGLRRELHNTGVDALLVDPERALGKVPLLAHVIVGAIERGTGERVCPGPFRMLMGRLFPPGEGRAWDL